LGGKKLGYTSIRYTLTNAKGKAPWPMKSIIAVIAGDNSDPQKVSVVGTAESRRSVGTQIASPKKMRSESGRWLTDKLKKEIWKCRF
jgi:hypothetical protein